MLLISGLRIAHLRTEVLELEWTGGVRYGRSDGDEIARNLKSGIKFDFQRDSTPIEGVRKDDHLVTAGVNVETRW